VNTGDDGQASCPAGGAFVTDIQMIWTFHALHSKTGAGSHDQPNDLFETK
jgi:hypothetical protein